tara:strand:- start:398 stop:2512 length:2115 start_codon:yes stop_codon:yes gene_type:complete
MKYLKYLKKLALIFIIGVLGCSSPDSKSKNSFALLPSVAEGNFTNKNSTLDVSMLKFAYSPTGDSLPIRYGLSNKIRIANQAENSQIEFSILPKETKISESYSLEIGVEKIKIEAQDKAGLFYSFITLNQILKDASEQELGLPLVEIKDSPKIAFRPIHIDVKHHLEKKSYYYDLLDEIAQLKINGIIVEIEDKLKYKRRPEVASSDAISIEEWRKISKYALNRNIKISPLVQGLGHASFVLKHDKNKHLRDDPESDWAFNPLDPETYNLQYDLYKDAFEAFPHGKYLHVGGDEVNTTGRESGKSALELNLIWLNKVSDFAAEHDRIPIFWDDMPLKQAGLMGPIYDEKMPLKTVDSVWEANEPNLNRFIEQFPKNCVYMRWNYHLAESYGNGKAMDWFSSNGFSVMGATAGQTRWTLMPQRESNIDQIRIFAEQSIKRNYNGLLLTLWDDDSPHFELYKRGISAFAEFTWGGLQRSKAEFKKVYRHRMFGPDFTSEEYAFIDGLDKPVAVWTNLLVKEGAHRNALNQLKNPIENYIIDLPEFDKKGTWTQKYSKRLADITVQSVALKEIRRTIASLQAKKTSAKYNLEVYNEVINLVDYNFKLMKYLSLLDNTRSTEEETKLIKDLQNLVYEFKEVRKQFEEVYGKSRKLNKPNDYILDQDHHRHPANQSINFDWQFTAELMLITKIKDYLKTQDLETTSKAL